MKNACTACSGDVTIKEVGTGSTLSVQCCKECIFDVLEFMEQIAEEFDENVVVHNDA